MKKFVLKYLFLQLVLVALIGGYFFIVTLHGQAYDRSFQGMISKKYECLKSTDSPKIVYVSGSSGLFGVDTDQLEQLTGKRVVNLALHAGFGTGFVTNMAVDHLQEGDLLVLAYEHTRWNTKPAGDAALLVSGIDNNIRLYSYIDKNNYMRILKYLPTHCMKKRDILSGKAIKPDESQSFDENGNLAKWKRDTTLPQDISEYAFEMSVKQIDTDVTAYAKEIRQKAQKRGAEVVLAAPPVLEEAVDSSGIDQFCEQLTKQTGIEWISDPRMHFFQREDMRDTIWHCNYYGKDKNTKQLAKELAAYFRKCM